MAEMRRRVNDSWLSAMVLAIDFEISSLKHVFEKRLCFKEVVDVPM